MSLLAWIRARWCSHVFAAPNMEPRNAGGIVVWPCSKCSYVARVPYGLAVPGTITGPWGTPRAEHKEPTK